jgi:maleate isomerase
MSWRAKLGVIYPADGALDQEYWQLVPPGVSVHITRISVPQEEQTLEVLEAQTETEDIDKAAVDLNVIGLNAIAYACTSGSFVHGVGSDLDIIRRMEDVSGVPCTTTSTAAVRALKTLGAQKLSIVTPYPDEINVRLKSFLEGHDFEVLTLKGLGLYRKIFNQPAGAAYQLAKEADTSEADTIFISCTNFRSVEVLPILEKDLDKPVLSANQVTVWDLLRMSGVHPGSEKYGRLVYSKGDTHENI